MSARVLPLRGSTHRVVDAMLPWYVNDTLEPDERALVQRHLDECAQCRREVDWLRELHAACIACADQERAGGAFHGLRQRLTRRAAARSATPHGGAWRSLPPLWRAAALAQLVAVAVLGWLLLAGDDTPRYRTLGSRDGARVGGNVVVVFDASATEAQMRELLRNASARIVDGPTRANAYVLAIPAAQQAHALEVLKASPGVALARSLGAPDAR